MRVVVLRLNMFVEQPLHGGWLEEAVRVCPRIEQHVAEERLQLATKPISQRDAEAHFAAALNGRRQQIGKRVEQDLFALVAAQF